MPLVLSAIRFATAGLVLTNCRSGFVRAGDRLKNRDFYEAFIQLKIQTLYLIIAEKLNENKIDEP